MKRRRQQPSGIEGAPAADVEGAIAVGTPAVWLDRYDDPWSPPAGAARISSLSELPALLASHP